MLALMALGGRQRTSEACSCVADSPEGYFKAVPLVFLARAEAPQSRRTATIQRLRILHALKGAPGAAFVISTPRATGSGRVVISTCERSFQDGEIALVFAEPGQEPAICAGNYDLAVVLPEIEKYLALGPDPPGPVTPELMAAAIRALPDQVLTGRLPPIHHPPLAGRAVGAHARCGLFTASAAGAELAIDQAVRFGPIAKVAMSVPGRPRRWFALLREVKGTWETLHLVEQRLCASKNGPPRWEPIDWTCSSPVAAPASPAFAPPPLVAFLGRAAARLMSSLLCPTQTRTN